MKFFFTERRSVQYLEFCFVCLCRGGEHAQKPKFGDGRFFSEKKLHKALRARFNFSRLSLAFILKYYPILHAVKR